VKEKENSNQDSEIKKRHMNRGKGEGAGGGGLPKETEEPGINASQTKITGEGEGGCPSNLTHEGECIKPGGRALRPGATRGTLNDLGMDRPQERNMILSEGREATHQDA